MQKNTLLTALVIFALFSTSCSRARNQCEQWQKEGHIFSSLYACEKCLTDMGTENPAAVKGCSIGMDATRLMSGV